MIEIIKSIVFFRHLPKRQIENFENKSSCPQITVILLFYNITILISIYCFSYQYRTIHQISKQNVLHQKMSHDLIM